VPSRRETIRMSATEVDAYLRQRSRVILVTIGEDGMPHPVPMNYGLDGAGRFILTSFRKSRKVANLRRDPRATLLVESGNTYAELKAVIAWCSAEVIEDVDEVARLMRLVRAEASLSTSISDGMSEQVRASLGKRAVLRFTPNRYASWDHARLGALY